MVKSLADLIEILPDHRTLVFFGPPGSGKSTKVAVAAAGGFKALDLELFSPLVRRVIVAMTGQHPSRFDVIGAADSDIRDWSPVLYTRILLLPEKQAYQLRRAARDIDQPGKASQGDYYAHFESIQGQFDLVIRN